MKEELKQEVDAIAQRLAAHRPYPPGGQPQGMDPSDGSPHMAMRENVQTRARRDAARLLQQAQDLCNLADLAEAHPEAEESLHRLMTEHRMR